MAPDGRLIPSSTSPTLMPFTKAVQKYVIVLPQSGARPVYSPVVASKVRGLFSHVGNETNAEMHGLYELAPLSRTICRHDLSILATSNFVPAPVVRTSSTVHAAGAWKNGSAKVEVLQLVNPLPPARTSTPSMPTESPTVPVPPFVSDAVMNVSNESEHVSPLPQTEDWTRNRPEVTGAIPVPLKAVAVSWKYPLLSILRFVNEAAPATAVTVVVPDRVPVPLEMAIQICPP